MKKKIYLQIMLLFTCFSRTIFVFLHNKYIMQKSFVYSNVKKQEIVNGKKVLDVDIKRKADNQGEEIVGHYGNQPIHIRRSFVRVPKTVNKRKKQKKKKQQKSQKKKNKIIAVRE